MAEGRRLLFEGKYSEAVKVLSVAAKKDWQDDFNVGPILDIGVALLLSMQFSIAKKHFTDLIEKTPYTVSKHYIYFGMAEWFCGNYQAALDIWKRARKCQYCGDQGLDVLFILHYANAKLGNAIDENALRSAIATISQNMPSDDYPRMIAEYLLRNIDDESFRTQMSVYEGRKATAWRATQIALAEFYVGVRKLEENDVDGFQKHINVCASEKKYLHVFDEYIIATMELKQVD